MTVNALDAYDLGYAMGSLMIPLIGLILLVTGLVQLTRSQKQPPPPPQPYGGYPQPPTQSGPPQPPPPPGFGPQVSPGYPSYLRPLGAPAQPPPAGHWPPTRPKRRGMGLIITGAVILVLSLLVGGLMAARSSTADEPSGIGGLDSSGRLEVGQCVAQDEFGEGAPVSADCSDPTATMELASLGGPDAECPDGKRRDATDYTTLFWDNATMCFVANLFEGECYALNMVNTSEAPFIREDCAGADATIRVVQRFDDTTEATRCPTATKPISYPQPARLYCIESLR